jgi:hypothetical protein
MDEMDLEGSNNETQSQDARPQNTAAESLKAFHDTRTGSAEKQSRARSHKHIESYTKDPNL